MRFRTFLWPAAAATALLCQPAHAQSPEQLLRGLMDAARQGQRGGNAPQPGVASIDLARTQPVAAPLPGPARWPTREAFLAATRAGELMEITPGSADNAPALASVMTILYREYQVPPISRECYEIGGFRSQVIGLLSDIAEVHAMTLSKQPPDFTDRQSNRGHLAGRINDQLAALQAPRDRTHCDGGGRAGVTPHPYKAALAQLASDYSKATAAVIEEERANRQNSYKQAVARQQAEQQQQQAETRAQEQRRIDTEAARIRADEQRRSQKEKARIGG